MDPALRAWLDRLLNVVDGVVDDVRYLAARTNHDAEHLSVRRVSGELVALRRELYQLPGGSTAEPHGRAPNLSTVVTVTDDGSTVVIPEEDLP